MLFVVYIYIYIERERERERVGRMFASGPEDLGSIPGHVIPKTLKMVLDTSLLKTQQYKVRIKDKVEQSWIRTVWINWISWNRNVFDN